ncbi:MAG: SH3 domain-containing protein [Alphaproteobacteria bacterium]|nr:SH3 domain-containing protein [Alphaproteobacteria bacterium]
MGNLVEMISKKQSLSVTAALGLIVAGFILRGLERGDIAPEETRQPPSVPTVAARGQPPTEMQLVEPRPLSSSIPNLFRSTESSPSSIQAFPTEIAPTVVLLKSPPPLIQQSPAPKTTPTIEPEKRLALASPESKPTTPIKPAKTKVRFVDASRLSVRRGPGTSYRQVWTLKRSEQVQVLGGSGEWRKVKGEQFVGWVHGGYLSLRPAVQKTAKHTSTKTPSIRFSGGDRGRAIKALIARSHAYYSGSCPCPYSRTRSGRKCGGNSAYSRPGGASPLCYARDISEKMIQAYLGKN